MAIESGRGKTRAKTTVHWHGCTRCCLPYEDNCLAIDDINADGLCVACRGGRDSQTLIDSRKPRACCKGSSRLATKDDRKTYRLAGARVWFLCASCYRTFPYDPRKEPAS